MTSTDLPIPDYDHLPLGDLTGRIRSLDAGQLDALLAFEEEHGARAPVLQVLRARREQVGAGAELSSGDPAADDPLRAPAPHGGSTVGQSTQGPKVNPPSHGTPANPAGPR